MAKFNIEVELDWMDEEAYSIDDFLHDSYTIIRDRVRDRDKDR